MSAMQIVNTSNEEIVLPRRNYQMQMVLPSRGKKLYSTRVIEDKIDYEIHFIEYDYTKAKKIPVHISALDICNDFFGNEKLAEHGCFMKAVGEAITEDDINAARARRKSWLETLVEVGDDEFLRTKKVNDIPTMCKRAVRELGVRREWAVTAPNPTVQCEACAGRVELLDNGKPPILCTFCHFPLDKDRAIEAGLWAPPEPRTPASALPSPSPKPKEK